MEDNKYYVYLHIKETTGEPFYVGKGSHLKNKKRYCDVSNRNKHWHNIVNKHGFDVIFLEKDLTETESLEREIYWIQRIGRKDLCNGPLVNFTDGGEGISGYKFSEESKNKIRLKQTGKKASDETKNKMSISQTGRKHSDETLKLCREINLGENNPMYGKLGSNSKLIINLETGIYYNSIHEAYILTPYSRPYLSMMLSGKRKNKTAFIYA